MPLLSCLTLLNILKPSCSTPVIWVITPCFCHSSYAIVFQFHNGFQLLLFVAHAACISVDALQLQHGLYPNHGTAAPGSSSLSLVSSPSPFIPSWKTSRWARPAPGLESISLEHDSSWSTLVLATVLLKWRSTDSWDFKEHFWSWGEKSPVCWWQAQVWSERLYTVAGKTVDVWK